MIINKYKQGGNALARTQLKNNTKGAQEVLMALSQALLTKPEELVELLKSNLVYLNAFQQAVSQYQQTGNIDQALTAFTQIVQSQTLAAKHGAKLNYIRRLAGQCAEDEETYFYKVGGKIGCGCRKKVLETKCGGKVKKHK